MASGRIPRVAHARGTDHASPDAYTHQPELAEAIAEDERRIGRRHTPRERAAFAEAFIQESRRLAAWKIGR
jgi:hypothetical protein